MQRRRAQQHWLQNARPRIQRASFMSAPATTEPRRYCVLLAKLVGYVDKSPCPPDAIRRICSTLRHYSSLVFVTTAVFCFVFRPDHRPYAVITVARAGTTLPAQPAGPRILIVHTAAVACLADIVCRTIQRPTCALAFFRFAAAYGGPTGPLYSAARLSGVSHVHERRTE